MFPRRTEPELMTGTAQARAYASADFSKPHSDIVRHFQRAFDSLPSQATVIDLGCGPADISIRLASLYPGFSIDAVDGSKAMLEEAARALATACLTNRVRLVRAVLPERSTLSTHGYDVIVSNSLLHHLHDPQVLWNTVTALGKAQAWVFVADLTRPGSEREARALVKKHAACEPEILQRDFYRSLLAAFTPQELHAQIKQAGLELRIETPDDHHVIVSGKITGRPNQG